MSHSELLTTDKSIDKKEQRTYLFVSMAENEEREVQDVLDEVDEVSDPSLDILDLKKNCTRDCEASDLECFRWCK